MDTPFKVSVRLITYNHEKFIAEAIESVLAQKTDFQVELIIADDFSTDDTLKIAKQFSSTQNVKVKILDRQKGDDYWVKRQKYGRLYNYYNTLKNCTGQYIALLDGDDFWMDPLKLQKQANFLDSNTDYVMCFHNSKFLRDNGVVDYLRDGCTDNKETYEFMDFIDDNVSSAHTSSYFFRNIPFLLPDDFYMCGLGDWTIRVLISEHGKTKYIDEVMSVYRIHSGGVWSGVGLKISLSIIAAKRFVDKHYKGKYHNYIYPKNSLLILYYNAFTYFCQSHQLTDAMVYAFKVIYTLKFSQKNPYTISRAGTIKRLVLAFLPKFQKENQIKIKSL